MKDLAEALKSILERIGQFLDLFDLSFFISGAVAAAGAWVWLYEAKRLLNIQLSGWLLVLAVVIGIYATGLICFCVGRLFRTAGRFVTGRAFRRTTYSSFDNCFKATLVGHSLDGIEPFKTYLSHNEAITRGIWMLYARLWADLRSDPAMATSMSLLNRYWVMAATYDGLAFALFLWALVAASFTFGWGLGAVLEFWLGVTATCGCICAALACVREAARYAEYQIYELVAATATRLSLRPDPKYASITSQLTVGS